MVEISQPGKGTSCLKNSKEEVLRTLIGNKRAGVSLYGTKLCLSHTGGCLLL